MIPFGLQMFRLDTTPGWKTLIPAKAGIQQVIARAKVSGTKIPLIPASAGMTPLELPPHHYSESVFPIRQSPALYPDALQSPGDD